MHFLKLLLYSASIYLFSLGAYAQDYSPALETTPAPLLDYKLHLKNGRPDLPSLRDSSQMLAAIMEASFRQTLAGADLEVKSCADPGILLRKVRGLRQQGNYQSCIDTALQCSDSIASQTLSDAQLALLEGAACAYQSNKIKEGYNIFDLATSGQFKSSAIQDYAVYRFSLFARNTEFESQITQILNRAPTLSEIDKNELKAILDLVNKGHAEGYSEAQLKDKILALSNKNTHWANEMVVAWLTHLMWNKYDAIGTIQFAKPHLSKVYEMERVYRNLFSAFYALTAEDFEVVKPTLEVYYKYITPQAWLPVENNIYTVYEQYNKVCRTTLAQGKAYAELTAIKKSWLNGTPLEEILQKITNLDHQYPDKADILTLKATAFNSLNRQDDAFKSYWQAHQLCPYYHRSHWGLHGIKKDRFYKSLSDYQSIQNRVAQEVQEGSFPKELQTYVMNWQMLTPEQQTGVKFAIKLWAPYVPGLLKAKTHLYIKTAFEHLSDVPGWASLRNHRAPAPDNRLLDELRGIGGNPVVSDLGETLRTPHGDYNLASHEIAHSWHLDYLPSVGRKDLQECIHKMYEAAKARNLFADAYAATHENEYFGQAISYYLIPEGAPARFGLNASWTKKYDPALHDFVSQIEKSNGDINQVRCPL